jgi:hypothetical protein
LQLLSLICNLAFFICFEQDLSLGCVHLSYAEAGCKLNNFLSNKALFIEKRYTMPSKETMNTVICTIVSLAMLTQIRDLSHIFNRSSGTGNLNSTVNLAQ